MAVSLVALISAGSTSSSDFSCTADTEAELLRTFQQTVAITSEADSEGNPDLYYNLTLTWQPSWGVDSWQRLGCLAHVRALTVNGSGLNYSLPDSFASAWAFPQLQDLRIQNSSLSGTLPASWGAPGAFQQLKALQVINNSLTGSLPESWGANGSFSQLHALFLDLNSLTGSLPRVWGSPDAFQKLQTLSVLGNELSGALPDSWGLDGGFPALETLSVFSNELSGALPDSWALDGAFPALKTLALDDNSLGGSLPVSWGVNGSLPLLQKLSLNLNRLQGRLPADWGTGGGFSALESLQLWHNRLSGSLPEAWGTNGAFPALQVMYLLTNSFSGAVPASWGAPGAFPKLGTLGLENNHLSGTLPESWGADGGFPELQGLNLIQNALTGTIPAAWARGDRFKSLVALDLAVNALEGELPCFNNPQLSLINLKNTSVVVSGESAAFWQSSSPILLLELSNTRVSGSLPQMLAFGEQLQLLHVDNTSLQGTIPFSWLGPNGTLSNIIFGGQALWGNSVASAKWRREVCLNPDIYRYDVAAKSQLVVDAVKAKLQHSVLLSQRADIWLEYFYTWVTNNTDSIYAICQNRGAPKVIAILWGSFLACVAVMVVAYIVAGCMGKSQAGSGCSIQVPQLLASAGRAAFGLFSLGLYCGAFANDVRVIVEVWGLWTGYALLANFLWHHVYRGLVVSFYFVRLYCEGARSVDQGHGVEGSAPKAFGAPGDRSPLWRSAVAVLWSPVGVVLSCVMDVWSFLDVFGVPSPALLQLESYADMRAVVMALFQSVGSAVITTVIFQLGNNPSSGIFYSVRLYTLCLAFSCASILMGLCRLLYISHCRDRKVLRTGFLLVTGRLLRPAEPAAVWRPFTGRGSWSWLCAGLGCCHKKYRSAENSKLEMSVSALESSRPKDPDHGFVML